MLTQKDLQSLLHYDPLTGDFTWNISFPNKTKSGQKAGCLMSKGYWRIKIDRKEYLAHRLAWLYVYGRWPAEEIDHIDGNKLNNKISNLRECSHQQNAYNFKTYRNNTSGFPGVTRIPKTNKWRAQIRVGAKTKYLGTFDTAQDAYLEYLRAKAIYHPFNPTHR